MKHILSHSQNSKKSAIKIIPIRKKDFAKKIKTLGKFAQSITKDKADKLKVGDSFFIRDNNGVIISVIKIIRQNPNIWSFAGLIKKLPEGIYEIDENFDAETATQITAGWEIGGYRFDRYKKTAVLKPKLLAPKNADLQEAKRIATSVTLARDLINTPPADLGPEEFAAQARKIATKYKAKITILKDKQLLKEGYEAIYTVGKASEKRPHLVDIRWGNAKHPKVRLVGKGVTFDTGGLNLKSGGGMRNMKKDMGGAAIVLATAAAIMDAKLPVNLRVLIPLAENHISDNAFRPSDVIRTRAGITVEVDNTDAEGRLILCEPLAEADSEKPDLLIDVATLTGAARVAVGTEISAFMTKDDKLAAKFSEKGEKYRDNVWRLPLYKHYERMLVSNVADLVNSPDSGMGGAITAALFLKSFVKNTKSWMHVDTNAWNVSPRVGRPVGGEAMAMRALYELIKERYKK